MKRVTAFVLGSLAATAMASTASAAPTLSPQVMAPETQNAAFTAADMDIVFGPDGTISATFGNSGILEGEFTDTYSFTLPQDGMASGSVSTSAVTLFGPTDLDFTSVFFNGVELFGTTGAQNEAVFANNVSIFAGVENVLTINGLSRGNGSYGGSGVFAPTAAPVPEPATWAFMLVGFGAVGYSMRRRPRRHAIQAV